MKYSNLDLSQLEVKDDAQNIGEMLGIDDNVTDSLATKMAEATKKVVRKEITTTIGLIAYLFPLLTAQEAALVMAQGLAGQVVEAIENNPMATLKVMLGGGR